MVDCQYTFFNPRVDILSLIGLWCMRNVSGEAWREVKRINYIINLLFIIWLTSHFTRMLFRPLFLPQVLFLLIIDCIIKQILSCSKFLTLALFDFLVWRKTNCICASKRNFELVLIFAVWLIKSNFFKVHSVSGYLYKVVHIF